MQSLTSFQNEKENNFRFYFTYRFLRLHSCDAHRKWTKSKTAVRHKQLNENEFTVFACFSIDNNENTAKNKFANEWNFNWRLQMRTRANLQSAERPPSGERRKMYVALNIIYFSFPCARTNTRVNINKLSKSLWAIPSIIFYLYFAHRLFSLLFLFVSDVVVVSVSRFASERMNADARYQHIVIRGEAK